METNAEKINHESTHHPSQGKLTGKNNQSTATRTAGAEEEEGKQSLHPQSNQEREKGEENRKKEKDEDRKVPDARAPRPTPFGPVNS